MDHQSKPHNISVGYFQVFNITVEGLKCLPSNVEFYPQLEDCQAKYWQKAFLNLSVFNSSFGFCFHVKEEDY